jgi:hypothetical protein
MFMRKKWLAWWGMGLLLAAGSGCERPDPVPASLGASVVIPPHLLGTVREFAVYDAGGSVPVQGYGLVTGLGKNGSREVPDHLRDYMIQYLARNRIGSAQYGTGHVSPMRVLQDLDTAIVLVAGSIPFGAPVGARFDLDVAALPSTQTRSLQGGNLMSADLRLYLGVVSAGGPTRMLAEGAGSIFLNPFVDPNDEADLAQWREGRILGGGRVTYAHPVHLQLRQPDYARASLIAKRINERLGARATPPNARDRATIELTVPAGWRDDYERFLVLVMHLPLAPPSQWQARARELVRLMEAPDAPCEDIAWILEAMGRNTVPVLKTLYASRNSAAAFYAARAAGRLGDDAAEQVLARLARQPRSVFQILAIEELGRNDLLVGAALVLRDLIDDDDNQVRIAAYEGLARRGDGAVLTRRRVEGQLTLDLVKSRRSYVIYATQRSEPRIALFGPEIPLSLPVYFDPADELAIIRSRPGDANKDANAGPELGVFRRLPDGRYTPVLACRPTVDSLIVELASLPALGPDGKTYHGLRLNYGEVLSVLARLCQRGDIPAKFNLQSEPSPSRIPVRGPAVGRPDVPGS